MFVGVCGQPKRDGLQRGAAAGAGGKNKSAESLQAAGLNLAEELSPLEAVGATACPRCLFVGDKICPSQHFLISSSQTFPNSFQTSVCISANGRLPQLQ